MKESKFNVFYEAKSNSQKILAYNSRSNALATINLDDFYKFKSCASSGNYDKLDKTFKKDLEAGYFIIEDSVDELDILRYEQQSARHNSQHLALTIAPTLGCNFDCIYCYEKEHGDFHVMSHEIQEAILDFISQNASTINQLSITWYGGEPLLSFDLIKDFSKKVINLCQEYNIAYSAVIVTNGYLLTEKISKEFKELNIVGVQITLDGPEDIHDTRRPLQGGQGTFTKIIENLKKCIEYLPNTSLRINVDQANKDRIYEVMDILKDNGLTKVFPYLGYVEPTNEQYEKEQCLTVNDFAKLEYNFENSIGDEYSNNKYPRLVSNNCCADSRNAFVIDPYGNLYKCWSDIGLEEYCLGNVLSGIDNKSRIYEYALYDPTMDQQCKECNILPICMGGMSKEKN